MKIIFLGAPGAGKGTQAEKVSERYNIPAISTGAIIREAIKTGTEMGLAAKAYTEKGALVPDEVVIALDPQDIHVMPDIMMAADKEGVRLSLIPFFNDYIPKTPSIVSLGRTKLIDMRLLRVIFLLK